MPLFNPSDPRHYWDKRFGLHIFEDFAVSTTGLFGSFVGSGGAVTFWNQALVLPTGWIGATRTQTGVSATGALTLGGLQPVALGQGATWFESKIRLPNLSDGTDSFYIRDGFIDNFNGEITDGAAIRYTHSVNGGRFEAYTRNNSVETAVDSGITVAINTDYVLRVEVNAAATQALFYINGALVATITTNIPSGFTRFTGAGSQIAKTLGTASREKYIDYLEFDYVFTTPRA